MGTLRWILAAYDKCDVGPVKVWVFHLFFLIFYYYLTDPYRLTKVTGWLFFYNFFLVMS